MTVRATLCLVPLLLAMSALRAEPVYVIDQLVVTISSERDGEGDKVAQVKSADKLELVEREGEQAHVRLPSGKEGWIKASYLTSEEPLQIRLNERTAEVEKLKEDSDKLRQDMSHLQSELAAARAAHSTPPLAASAPAGTGTTAANRTPPAATSAAATSAAATSVGATSASGTRPASSLPTATALQKSPPATAIAASAAPGTSQSSDNAVLEAGSDALSGSSAPVRETVFLREPGRKLQTPWALLLGVSAVMLLAGFLLGWMSLDRRIRHRYGGLKIY